MIIPSVLTDPLDIAAARFLFEWVSDARASTSGTVNSVSCWIVAFAHSLM
jgi:hypothetical protein